MISVNVSKHFDTTVALDNIKLQYETGKIFGLVGANGSGKSTLLRLISGVYQATEGAIELEGSDVFENAELKSTIFFVSDDFYFDRDATLENTALYLKTIYKSWDDEVFRKLCDIFLVGMLKKKITTFSKGMKRQAALMLALSCSPKYLLLDEAFDGIDPVIRFTLRRVISDIMSSRDMGVIISSHNLRELEDFCDAITVIHKGKTILSGDMDAIQTGYCKLQLVLKQGTNIDTVDLPIISKSVRGSVVQLVCGCSPEAALEKLESLEPVMCETLPLTLEEIFVYQMEVAGYDYKNITF